MDKETFFDFITREETWDLDVLLYLLNLTPEELCNFLSDSSNELEWSSKTEFKTIFISSNEMSHHVPIGKTLYVKQKVKHKHNPLTEFKPVHCPCSLES